MAREMHPSCPLTGQMVELRVFMPVFNQVALFFFFFTLVTGPRKSLSLKLSDTRVYEPQVAFSLWQVHGHAGRVHLH